MIPNAPTRVTRLEPAEEAPATDILCRAFADYPVMRFVLGDRADFPRRLATLIGFVVAARFLRRDPVFGLAGPDGTLLAVALVTLPTENPSPGDLDLRREAVWHELGADTRARYDAYGNATRPFATEHPHHHLNMIGVLPAHAGHGLGRMLFDHVHEVAATDPRSTGVSLNTETPTNVALYEHLGYVVRGHAVVAPGLETWGLFRPHIPSHSN